MSTPEERFAKFDWDKNEAWQNYLTRIYIVPDSNSRAALNRIKRKWYKGNFEDIPLDAPAPTPRCTSSASTSSRPPKQSASMPPTNPQSYDEARPYVATSKFERIQQLVHWTLNLMTVYYAVLWMITGSTRAYRLSMLNAALLFGILTVGNLGVCERAAMTCKHTLTCVTQLPRFSATYLQRIFLSLDGQMLIHSLMLLPAPPMLPLLMPTFLCAAVNTVGPAFVFLAAYIPALNRRAASFHSGMARLQCNIQRLNAQLEVFIIIVLALRRSLFVTVGFFQLTVMRYYANPHTRAVWVEIGRRIDAIASHAYCPRPVSWLLRKVRASFQRHVTPQPPRAPR